MLPKLLHIANSDPPSPKQWRDRFYAMKNRILKRWAVPDGDDWQALEGKICFSCGGTGGYYEPGGCYKCDGDGWFRSPRIVQLKRWRFGRFVFHEPGLVAWRKASESDKVTIHGFIEHASYDYRQVLFSTFLLAIVYDRGLAGWAFRRCFERSHYGFKIIQAWKALTRRCYICGRQLWSSQKWQCEFECRSESQVRIDEEQIPF